MKDRHQQHPPERPWKTLPKLSSSLDHQLDHQIIYTLAPLIPKKSPRDPQGASSTLAQTSRAAAVAAPRATSKSPMPAVLQHCRDIPRAPTSAATAATQRLGRHPTCVKKVRKWWEYMVILGKSTWQLQKMNFDTCQTCTATCTIHGLNRLEYGTFQVFDFFLRDSQHSWNARWQ